jgi:protein-L-isoaspartate(D-aspartate) O-methyltransferase
MDEVAKAFKAVRRSDFLPPEQIGSVDLDAPLAIGYGQTNSQPTTVRLMLEWLEVEPGNKILDVGSGSGWTSALLARLTGPSGTVYAVELVPELVNFGSENCQEADIDNVKFYRAGKDYGLPRFAPYDRILVSAAAQQLPKPLLDQLKPTGKMVIPVLNDVLEIEKDINGKIDIFPHPGFAFVPLVNPAGY